MLLDSVKIGDRLEILLKREKNRGKAYVSQVEEKRSGNQVVIHMPISYGQLVKLPISENYSVLFFTEKGMLDFDASVVGYMEEDGFKYLLINITSSGERIQRREFFRYSCIVPFRFCAISNGSTADGNEVMVEGIIKDLGGGGIRFVTNEDLEERNHIKCLILLGDDLLIVEGKVLHKQYFPKSNYKYQYRVQFTDIMQPDQEIVIQYIFNEQRKHIRLSKIEK